MNARMHECKNGWKGAMGFYPQIKMRLTVEDLRKRNGK